MTDATNTPFKKLHSLEERKRKFGILREQQPDRVHVILEPSPGSRLPFLEKRYYPCAPNTMIGQLTCLLKTHVQTNSPEDALFLMIAGNTPASSSEIGDLHLKYHDEDGFLYIYYCGEASFG